MNETSTVPEATDERQPVVLRGTGRGLEIVIDEAPPLYDVIAELESRLSQSPDFFCGASAVIHLGARALPPGGLAHLKAVTDRYGLRIVELRADRPEIQPAAQNLAIPVAAAGDGGAGAAAVAAAALGAEAAEAARLLVGPVRSGGAEQSTGHLVVMGDVNHGAEIRAGGNIVVVGALRGLAHATCGGQAGWIVALRLEAQQIRIGGLIARAGDPLASSRGPEIAYAAGGRIVVEPYQGKLPGGYTPPVKR